MNETNTRRVLASPAVIGAGAAVALAAWGAFRLGGVDIAAGPGDEVSPVTALDVAVAAVAAGMAAWAVFTLMARHGLINWWPFTGSTVLAVSMAGPAWMSDGASAMALMTMHLVVAVVLITGLSLTRRAEFREQTGRGWAARRGPGKAKHESAGRHHPL